MARRCMLTGAGTTFGNNRSWSKRATRRSFKVNLQKLKVGGGTIKISNRARRTLYKQSQKLVK